MNNLRSLLQHSPTLCNTDPMILAPGSWFYKLDQDLGTQLYLMFFLSSFQKGRPAHNTENISVSTQ